MSRMPKVALSSSRRNGPFRPLRREGPRSMTPNILLCLPLGYLAHQEISLEPMAASCHL